MKMSRLFMKAAAAVLVLGSLGWASTTGTTPHASAESSTTVATGNGTTGNWGWE